MKFLPSWLRLFLCWITGGHKYADKNLKTYYNPNTRQSSMWNYCVKCGTAYLFKINTDEIVKRDIEEYEKRREKYRKWLVKDGADND